ncbi:MAG: DUF6438 domain-containing protein [Saprospiraceae bacterium]
MKNFLLLLALATSLVACDPYQYDAASRIELKKDPCFGFCPVYTFTVDGKGNATFKGERNVEKEGDWTRTLTPEEVNALFAAFEKSDFQSFQDEYTAQVTDLPTTWVTFRHAAIDRTIKDYYGGPAELKNLEKLVEAIAETEDGWTKKNDNPGQ